MAHNYTIQVTAGPSYDVSTHKVVSVNTPTPLEFESELISAKLNIRVQNYRGLPKASPSTSPYFTRPPHDYNKDQYSISFAFTPKRSFNGNDLVFGNDLDHSIKDRLPPGLNTAFKIAKWFVDPGLEADFYADKPWLVSPLGSGINTLYLRAGPKHGDQKDGEETTAAKNVEHAEQAEHELGMSELDEEAGLWVEEGGDLEGLKIRRHHGVPDDEAARKKHFLSAEVRKAWTWEEGVEYACDFYNPYLDFSEFALRLPGFTLHMMSYWDGQPLRPDTKDREATSPSQRSHAFRYVLKDRATDTALLVIVFTLHLKDDIDDEGRIKPTAPPAGLPFARMDDAQRERHEQARKGVPEGEAREEGSSEEDEARDAEVKADVKAGGGGGSVPGGWDDDGVD